MLGPVPHIPRDSSSLEAAGGLLLSGSSGCPSQGVGTQRDVAGCEGNHGEC